MADGTGKSKVSAALENEDDLLRAHRRSSVELDN
jgi:hypothetical protein